MFTYRGKDFLLDGKKFNIYSGVIHYFRVLPEYWEDRLLKLKLAGFNTVETYVCWNLHEPKPGVFDFSGMLDLVRFVETAKKVGLYAIVRPGPYICAEWDFGGLPAWLLKDKNMRLRCMYDDYLNAVSRFYHALLPRLLPLQEDRGGNLIAMQVENEYGSYGNDKDYLSFVEKLMLDCGVTCMLFTSDGPQGDMLSGGTLPHIYKVGNFGSGAASGIQTLEKYQPNAPFMCGEFWDGWFDHWGVKHHTRTHLTIIPELKTMLKADGNFNFYMFHGGTNFGFTAGANHDGRYRPTVTSYDYDALLNEWGGYTPKYHAVRKVLLEHQNLPAEPLPAEPKRQTIGDVKLDSFAGILDNLEVLGEKFHSACAEHMEYYGQNFGLIHYHHTLKGDYSGKLHIDKPADRAYVFINKKYQGVIDRNDKNHFLSIPPLTGENDIDVLVEAMGRVNYGPELMDRKGVFQIRINNQILFGWDVYTIALDNLDRLAFSKGTAAAPVVLRGSFKAACRDDCFVYLKGFKKGYVFINGFNLGRYWEIGPQESLYLPGVLLKEENEIMVVELEGHSTDTVSIRDTHSLSVQKNIFRKLFKK